MALTFRSRLIAILLFINFSVLLLGLCAFYALGQTGERLEYLTGQVYSRILIVDQLRNAAQQRAISVRNMALLKQESARLAQATQYEKFQADTAQALAELKQATQDEVGDIKQLVAAIAVVEAKYAPVANEIVGQLKRGDNATAIQKIDEICTPTLAQLTTAIDAYTDDAERRTKDFVSKANKDTRFLQKVLLLVMLIVVTLTAALGVILFRGIHKTLGREPEELNVSLNALADGDLSSTMELEPGYTDSIAHSVVHVQHQIGEIVRSVRTSSETIEQSASHIALSNQDLNTRAKQQQESLQQTSSAMAELSSIVQANSGNAREADKLARDASQTAMSGGAVVAQVVEKMDNISSSGKRIADIIGMIDSIAFQTNILALNAAVEAARAGEQGRGFAVVATEVRALAQRSANSAREIKQLLGLNVEQIEQGSALVAQAGQAMQAIVGSIQQLNEIVSRIAHSAADQDQGITQVQAYIAQMTAIIEQNAILVEGSADAALHLQAQSDQLVQSVAVFKLN